MLQSLLRNAYESTAHLKAVREAELLIPGVRLRVVRVVQIRLPALRILRVPPRRLRPPRRHLELGLSQGPGGLGGGGGRGGRGGGGGGGEGGGQGCEEGGRGVVYGCGLAAGEVALGLDSLRCHPLHGLLLLHLQRHHYVRDYEPLRKRL
eukprot:1185561-Prorocentrum_minimum.AAC.1